MVEEGAEIQLVLFNATCALGREPIIKSQLAKPLKRFSEPWNIKDKC